MINILLIKKNDDFIKFRVFGHSGYDVLGKDIVCAAVSSVTQSIIIGLEKAVNEKFNYILDEDNSLIFVDVSMYKKSDLDKAQILFNTFKYTIESLILDYDKYISMRIEEEQL